MAQATDQEIPAELKDGFDTALGIFTWKDKPFVIKERHPFRIPTLQGCRTIRPPIPRGSQVSDAMCAWRHIFGAGVKCFDRQPATDGAEPDGIGGYGRDWWFDEAVGKLPWYFNYFIQQTIDGYLSDTPPKWCRIIVDCCAITESDDPNKNNHNGLYAWASDYLGRQWRTHIKRPAAGGFFANLLCWELDWEIDKEFPAELTAYEISDEWECDEITWNNQPALGRKLDVLTVDHPGTGWHTFNVGNAKAITIVCTKEKFQFRLYNIGHAGDHLIPCWT